MKEQRSRDEYFFGSLIVLYELSSWGIKVRAGRTEDVSTLGMTPREIESFPVAPLPSANPVAG